MIKNSNQQEDLKVAQITTSTCAVKIFAGVGATHGKFVVIATDLTSRSVVANQIEAIATDIPHRLKIEPKKLIFIEHRRATQYFEETFDLVKLTWLAAEQNFFNPKWSPVSKELVERMTGENMNQFDEMKNLQNREKQLIDEISQQYQRGDFCEADKLKVQLNEVRAEIYETTVKSQMTYQQLPNK